MLSPKGCAGMRPVCTVRPLSLVPSACAGCTVDGKIGLGLCSYSVQEPARRRISGPGTVEQALCVPGCFSEVQM